MAMHKTNPPHEIVVRRIIVQSLWTINHIHGHSRMSRRTHIMKIAQEEWHRKPASYLLSNYTTAICRVAFLSLVRNRYSSLLCIQCLKLARRFIALPTSSQVSSRWIHCIDLKIASNNDSTLLHAVQTQESERERARLFSIRQTAKMWTRHANTQKQALMQ